MGEKRRGGAGPTVLERSDSGEASSCPSRVRSGPLDPVSEGSSSDAAGERDESREGLEGSPSTGSGGGL